MSTSSRRFVGQTVLITGASLGVDRDDRPREWKLVVVALPTGEEVGELPIGTISAGHLALSKRAERIAFTRSDTDREVRVFRRDA